MNMDRTMTLSARQEKARRISPTALIRQSGLLAVVAGAYLVLLPFVHPSDDVGVQSAAWVPVHLLYFAALMVMLLVWSGSSPSSSSKPADWA